MNGVSLSTMMLRDGNNDEGAADPKAKLREQLSKGNVQKEGIQNEETPTNEEENEEDEEEEEEENDDVEEKEEEKEEKEEDWLESEIRKLKNQRIDEKLIVKNIKEKIKNKGEKVNLKKIKSIIDSF